MTNAFSKDYKPTVDLAPVTRENRISKVRTKQRAKAINSDDPIKRANARGDLGPLSDRGGKSAA